MYLGFVLLIYTLGFIVTVFLFMEVESNHSTVENFITTVLLWVIWPLTLVVLLIRIVKRARKNTSLKNNIISYLWLLYRDLISFFSMGKK